MSKIVTLNIRETKGAFSYNRAKRYQLRRKKAKEMIKGRNISERLPKRSAPQGIWLKIGKNGGKEK
jgi:hypothetical protein